MSDRQLRDLIAAHQNGCPTAADRICRDLDDTVRRMSNRYFFPGADSDDVIQLGRLGVFHGVRTFRLGRHNSNVRAFLLFCAERSMITGLKDARRRKNMVLSESVSLAFPLSHQANPGEPPLTVLDVTPDGKQTPLEQVSEREDLRRVVDLVNTGLTATEKSALLRVVDGFSYADDPACKSIDNGVQRARRKLKLAMAA